MRIERFDVDLMQRHAGEAPDQSGRQQPETQAGLPRVTPASRPRSQAATVPRPSPIAGSTGGLNVIV
jgi:hypothetical protein